MRTLVVWCPDWPVVAAGVPLGVPAIVVHGGRVVACSPAARAEGVALHQRRREAQARCPELVVVEHDPAVDARAFEPVAGALEALTPRLEVTHPGCCAFPTRGPSRYHGGDEALAERAARLAGAALGGRGVAVVGVADGMFAARLAARSVATLGVASASGTGAGIGGTGAAEPGGPSATGGVAPASDAGNGIRGARVSDGGMGGTGAAESGAESGAPSAAGRGPAVGGRRTRVIAPGDTPAFLAPQTVDSLDRRELVDVFRRLGLRTLGDLAALPVATVVGRFGAEGLVAHRLASGLDERPPAPAPPPPGLGVVAELDPPAERVEAAAFVARGLADDLARRLLARGSACTRLVIGAETEHGERHERVWRTEGTFTAAAIAGRARWQIEGWLQTGGTRPTGGLTRLWLTPDEVVPAGGRQLALTDGAGPATGDAALAADRAARALARLQGLVGVETVLIPEWRGGRGPRERVALVPAATVDVTEPRPAARDGWVREPWPGRIPDPAPALVHGPPVPAEVADAAGRPVEVSGRGLLSAAPVTVAVGGERDAVAREVRAWAGPWPCDERWWDEASRRRVARLQVLAADDTAYLLVVESGRWWVEATYD